MVCVELTVHGVGAHAEARELGPLAIPDRLGAALHTKIARQEQAARRDGDERSVSTACLREAHVFDCTPIPNDRARIIRGMPFAPRRKLGPMSTLRRAST